MCGISAIYRYTSISEKDKETLSLMNREMVYRGPDENGVWSDDKCGFAHTRLSIIGLDNGKQPLFNEDRSLVLICNGEIYNYIELKEQLIEKGHVFNSDTDSETILHLYEEYGVSCLDHLRGMFAFCLWDINNQRMFAARDRVGEKILYYSQLPTGIVFSTELKAILKYHIPNPQLNIECLNESIRYNYSIELKDTYIKQIQRLQPGEYAIVDENGLEFRHYWKKQIPKTRFTGTIEEAKVQTLDIMRESVRLCLRSDVPVAILLSGGIDSSAVAALAKEAGREVHVICAGYTGNHQCDERDVAKRFAEEKGLIYHEVELSPEDFTDSFSEYMRYMDEPACDASAMAQFVLYKKAKALGFTVLLGGLGGDEIFYGYPYFNKLSESIALTNEHQKLFPWKGVKKKVDYIKFLMKNWRHILFAGYPMKLNDDHPTPWTLDDYNKFRKSASIDIFNDNYNFEDVNTYFSFPMDSTIDDVYSFTFTRFMSTMYLYLADRLGMANAIEIRSPLIDYKLVDFVASLPTEMKYKKGEPKYFLKEVLRGVVPDYILFAPKRGFTPPSDYVKQMSKEYQYNYIDSNHVFFNSMLVDKLLTNLDVEK